jgi:glycosyltransferase involved in cell wall biosynthesis
MHAHVQSRDEVSVPPQPAADADCVKRASAATDAPIVTPSPIIALAPNSWVGPWTGRQQLLSRLANRGWPVVYSTGALSVYDRHSPKWCEASIFAGTSVMNGVNVEAAGRLLVRWPRFRFWDQRIVKAHARSLLRIARSLGDRRPVLFLFHPKFVSYADAVPDLPLVYHAFDTYAGLPGWTGELAGAEAELVERASVILASSDGIGADLPGTGPARYHLLENGADVEMFSSGSSNACPADLARIPHPRIGYVGRVTSKLNFALMAELAIARADWQWVFVGPVVLPKDHSVEMGAVARVGLESLRRLPNVHFLGEKLPIELPAYVAHMEVNTLCYRLEGGWWVNCYPLKLHEYLASGRPVVSTPLNVVRPFAAVVALAESRCEWISALASAIDAGGVGSVHSRIEVASRNSWDRRVDVLEHRLLQPPQLTSHDSRT